MDSFVGVIFVTTLLVFLFVGEPDMYDAMMYHFSGGDMDALAEWAKIND